MGGGRTCNCRADEGSGSSLKMGGQSGETESLRASGGWMENGNEWGIRNMAGQERRRHNL